MPTQTVPFEAFLAAVKAKTGKTPADFAKLSATMGFTKPGQYVSWLKAEHGLGHGHAMAVAGALLKGDQIRASPAEKLDGLFAGTKATWRPTADRLIATARAFGPDVAATPNLTYVSLTRGTAKFALIQPSSGKRLDIGLKLKGVPASGRLATAAGWNDMVTHRVSLSVAALADDELNGWLRLAYDAI